VARARKARKREERSRDRERMTRGRICQLGGGARGAVSAASGGGRSGTDGEAAVPEEDEAGGVQGLLCKLKLPIDTKS
jgi:hypothetical protein